MKNVVSARMIGVIGVIAAAYGLGACAGAAAPQRTVRLDATSQESAMTQPEPPVEVTAEGCTIERLTIPSKSMHRDIKVAIVLPPRYAVEKNERFPVLYTLHGAGAPYATFAAMEPLRRSLREHPMIVTCFDGDKAGWYIDSTTKPESQFATFFFKEFIPYVDGHYRTRADGASRALTGFSMGGYGAFNYMLMHPDMFAGVSGMSGVYDVLTAHDGKYTFGRLLGPYAENKAAYEKYGIYNRLTEAIAKGQKLPPMFIACGTEDGLVEQNRALVAFLIERNRKLHEQKKDALIFQYKESPGEHKWAYWRDTSADVADFTWRCFEQAAAAPAAKAAPSTGGNPK